jgi:hypothetical protein
MLSAKAGRDAAIFISNIRRKFAAKMAVEQEPEFENPVVFPVLPPVP